MNLNTKSICKKRKQEIILDYVRKIYEKERRFVSKREIRNIFHVELYNYFKNIFDMYRQINVEVPLCYCPRDYAVNKILEFVKNRSKQGLYPTKIELEQGLRIHIRTYFKNLKEIYEKVGINFKLYEKRKYEIEHPIYSEKKTQEIKNKTFNYLRNKTKKGFYPGVNQIQKELKIAFYKYFSNPYEAYISAGLEYERVSPITLGKKKEEMLTNIFLLLLDEMSYEIKRVSIYDKQKFNKGEDIRAIDINNNEVLIELKAYRKDYNIIKREIEQLGSYMKKQKINKGLFITTSNKVNYKLHNIKIINGYKLIELLKKYNLNHLIKNIRWIQEERVNLYDRIEFKERKRREITEFIINHHSLPSVNEIEDNLKIDMRTYFNTDSLKYLIKEIKNKFNNDSDSLCKAHRQVFLNTWLASHSKYQSQHLSLPDVVLQPLHLIL